MINKLKLKCGTGVGKEVLEFQPGAVTVFVGPNNSGKSQVLREIADCCRSGRETVKKLILDSLSFHEFQGDAAESLLAKLNIGPAIGEQPASPGNIIVGRLGGSRTQVNAEACLAALVDPASNLQLFSAAFLNFFTLIMDGKGRLTTPKPNSGYDLKSHPRDEHDTLFKDRVRRERVRRICFDAFGLHFGIDPTAMGKLSIAYSRRPPIDHANNVYLTDEIVEYFRDAIPLAALSDGVKAFTGIIVQLIAGDPRVIVVDEPEAFLHPAIAQRLGREMAIAASEEEKRLFVATHSANFLMGCVHSGVPINIVRLTYTDGAGTARLLSNDELLHLMRHPLLRSTRMLDGLFFESVVVVEGDSDRAFYQEINERLLRFDPVRGLPNCHFVNAQNKQTVHKIVGPLRRMGIPAAAIVDIDILKDAGKPFTDFLVGGMVPQALHLGLGQTRGELKRIWERCGQDLKRTGITVLSAADQVAFRSFFAQLAEFGLFVLDIGEVERWLPELCCSGPKEAWLPAVFEKMGEDPENPQYVKPAAGDVWGFIARIKDWTRTVGARAGA